MAEEIVNNKQTVPTNPAIIEAEHEAADKDDEDVVVVSDDYVKQLQREDQDRPAVRSFLGICFAVTVIAIIWALVSIDGILTALVPFMQNTWKSITQFLAG